MPVKRKTIDLAVDGNRLTATDAQSGQTTTDAGIQGEDGAVWLHAAVPPDWQDLSVRLQVLARNGAFDESDPAQGGALDMPLRQGLTVPGRLAVRLVGSDTGGIRKTADVDALTVAPSAIASDPVPHLYPYPVHRITGSGGALVTQTDNDTWSIDVTGTGGGDMLQANYANGSGQGNFNVTDHAAYADAAGSAGSAAPDSALAGGWSPLSGAASYLSAAAPSFQVTVAGDVTGQIGPGMRLKLTQAAVKFFIVTAVSYSSATGLSTLTLYGGTDYALTDAAITDACFSTGKAPRGFPLSPDRWTVSTLLSGSDAAIANPATNAWTNIPALNMAVPAGLWDLEFNVSAYIHFAAAAADPNMAVTLSTAVNSASDNELTAKFRIVASATSFENRLCKRKTVSLSAPATYYLLIQTQSDPGPDNMAIGGNTAYDSGASWVRARCAYL